MISVSNQNLFLLMKNETNEKKLKFSLHLSIVLFPFHFFEYKTFHDLEMCEEYQDQSAKKI